jgi:hypothetical protein
MKATLVALLMLTSTSLLADRPDCTLTPGGCVGNPPGKGLNEIAAVPEPGTAALIGMELAGLVIARRRK